LTRVNNMKNSLILSLLSTNVVLRPVLSYVGPLLSSSSVPALQAVSKKDSYTVTLLPGDGIGPEITEATKVAVQALCDRCNFSISFTEALIGGAAIDAVNDPFPDTTLQQCQQSDSVLLACIGGYKWDSNPRELRPETGFITDEIVVRVIC
jgi:Isocitrate/isopropylmalate dehydrogenase